MIGFKLNPGNLESAFKKLSDAVGENALRAAGAAGAALLRDEAKAQLVKNKSVDTGYLHDNIIIKRIEENCDGNKKQVYRVLIRRFTKKYRGHGRGARGKARAGKEYLLDVAFYWRFLEFGTAKMGARPFMRPAFDARREDALNKMREVLKVKLQKALK